MAGNSATIPAIRDAAELVLTQTLDLKVYDHEPKDLDALPAATLGLPKLERRKLGEAERELGRWTWTLRFPLTLYVALDNVEADEDYALQLLGSVVGSFDNNETLFNAGGVMDTKLETAEPGFSTVGTREMIVYTCSLAVEFEVS
jgi:hypothetical protein